MANLVVQRRNSLKLTFQARRVGEVVRLYSVDHADLFITIFCATYDPETRRLVYACGGQNPPLRVRAAGGAVDELQADGRSKVEAAHGLDATLAGYGRLYERAAERTAQA